MLAATIVAVQGLFRVVGAPAAQPVSEQSPSLQLGVAGTAKVAPVVVLPTPIPTPTPTPSPSSSPPPKLKPVAEPLTQPVVVINATAITGLAGRTAALLRQRGVTVASIGNLGAADRPSRPTVFYPPGGLGQAETLASLSHAPTVAPAPGWLRSGGRLVLVITDSSPLSAS